MLLYVEIVVKEVFIKGGGLMEKVEFVLDRTKLSPRNQSITSQSLVVFVLHEHS